MAQKENIVFKNRKFIIGAIVLLAVFASSFMVGAFNDGVLSINPTSGNWNYPGSYVVTNTTGHQIEVRWLVDCWNEACQDRSGSTIIEPGKSFTEGAGYVCGKWQLDLWWDGGSWGGIAEPSCDGGPQDPPCEEGGCVWVMPPQQHRECIIPIAGVIVASGATIDVVYDKNPGRPEKITVYGAPDSFWFRTDLGEEGVIVLTPGTSYGDDTFESWGANGCYISQSSNHPNGQESAPMTGEARQVDQPICVPTKGTHTAI